MTNASPTVRRRELGARLRALRLAAGMTVEDVAGRMEVSPAKISRIETAARPASVADVRYLCELYQVSTEERDGLLSLSRESKQRSWWQQYGLPEGIQTYVGLEQSALELHTYETSFVPALLQTEAYADALTAGTAPNASADQVTQLVQARITRQQRLLDDPPLQLWAVVDEVALYRLVGTDEIMRDQLTALTERSRLPSVTVQVIPLEAGAHIGMDSAFTVLHLAEVKDVVYVEGLIGNFYLENPGDLARYRKAFDQLRAIAMSPRDSVARIQASITRFSS